MSRMIYEVTYRPHPDDAHITEKRAARIRKKINPELWGRWIWKIGTHEDIGLGMLGGVFWVEKSSYSSHEPDENTTYPNKGLAVAAAKKAIRDFKRS